MIRLCSMQLLQGMNESADFGFLQRLLSYLASAETVCDLLLPAETPIHEKWLVAETVHVILLPAETLSRKLSHMDSLSRKLFTEHSSLGRKQEITDISTETKYDGQSLQKAKISRLIYTL